MFMDVQIPQIQDVAAIHVLRDISISVGIPQALPL